MKLDTIIKLLMILDVCKSELITEGTAFASGMAVLKCNLKNTEPIDEKKMVYYWQKDIGNSKHEVLFEMSNGEQNEEHVDKKYKNRTMELQPNWDLHIYNVTLDDEGTYSCHVSKKSGWAHKSFKLYVFDMKNPEISLILNWSVDSVTILELECNSWQCFPKPQGVIWNVHNSSGTHIIPANFTAKQNENAKGFNISSAITLHIEDNANISCVLQSVQNLTSKHLEIVIKVPIQTSANLEYIAFIVLVIPVILVGIAICLKRRNRSVSGESNGTTQNGLPLNATPRNNTEQPEEQTSFMNENTHGS